MSIEDAINELSRGARSQFCPLVVKAFFGQLHENKYSGRVKFKEKASGNFPTKFKTCFFKFYLAVQPKPFDTRLFCVIFRHSFISPFSVRFFLLTSFERPEYLRATPGCFSGMMLCAIIFSGH